MGGCNKQSLIIYDLMGNDLYTKKVFYLTFVLKNSMKRNFGARRIYSNISFKLKPPILNGL